MQEQRFFTWLSSPLGKLLACSNGRALTGLYTPGHRPSRPEPWCIERRAPFFDLERQLAAYFAGERTCFDLPLAPEGTIFQRRVWTALSRIPYGETTTYGALARRIGKPSAARAVGAANAKNPISILIPCHRVIGSDGSPVGYAGGLGRKHWLLAHERAAAGARDLRSA